MKKALILAILMSTQVQAYSIGQTVASPILTAGALLQITVVAPTAATAVSIARKQEAREIQQEINIYDAIGEVSPNLFIKIEKLRSDKTFSDYSTEELIDLIDEVTSEVLAD